MHCRIVKVLATCAGIYVYKGKKKLNRKSAANAAVSCWHFITAVRKTGEKKNWWGPNMSSKTVKVKSMGGCQFGKGFIPFLQCTVCSGHTTAGVTGAYPLSWRVNHTAVGRLSDDCVQEGASITMVGHSGSGIWMPCLSRGPDINDSSSSLSAEITVY